VPDSSARVTGDFSDLVRNAENAAKTILKVGEAITGIAAASKAFDVATAAIGGTVNALARIGLAAQGIEAIGKSAVAMSMGLLKSNAALEMTTISFKTLLGSAQAADQMIKDLTTFAANTPFNLPGLESSTQRLLAAGYAAKDIIPLMTSLGDSISALGGTQDQLNSLVYVFGQLRNEAKLNAGDIMQMSNLGIPALQMLADHYGKTTSEIQQMIHDGLIPGKEAAAIFATEMEKKYGGMMAAQSQTFSGMISNLQDWATATLTTLSKPFFEPAKKALKAFLDYVQSPAGVAAVNHLAAAIQKGVDKATAAFVRFEPQIKPTLTRLLQMAEAVRSQMTPGIITLIPLLFKFWERIEPLALSIYKVYQAIQPMNIAFAVLKGLLTGGLQGGFDALRDRFAMIEGYVKKGLDLALAQIKIFGPKVLDFLFTLGASIISWVLGEIPVVTRYLLQLANSFVNWVLPIVPKVLNALTYLATQIINWVIGEIPVFTTALLGWATTLVNWVLATMPRVLNALGLFGTMVINWIEKEIPIVFNSLKKWTDILAGWIIPAIPGVVRALEQLGLAIVNWGVTRLPVLIGDIIVGIGKGFGVNLQRPVADVLKVFNSLVNSIRSTVLPAFLQMLRFLSTDLMPIIDRLATFIANTLIPTTASLAAFVMTTLVPAFVRAADLLGLIFGPSLTLIGSIIRNELLPALTDSWTYFDGKYMPTVKDLASALGDKLAEGIRVATDKFKDAIPKLEDFYKKIEPIVGKALDLYKAISPISIALDVLKGFVTGGLQGGLGALEQHVVDLGKVFGLDLQPVIDWFNDTVVKKVIPTLKDWANTFITEWWPKIRDAVVFVWQKLGDFWTFVSTKIWPPFSDFLKWLGDQWGKVGKSIGDTWENTIKPAIKEFIRWIAEELWPKLRDDVFPWIDKNVRPKLEAAFDIIAKHIIPDIGKLIDIILNKVIPALVAWWGVLFSLINPFLKTLGDFIVDITGGLKDQKDPLGKAIDDFGKLADVFKKDVAPILGKVADGFHTLWMVMGGWLIGPIFNNLNGLIKLIGLTGSMIDHLIHFDIAGVAADAQKAIEIVKGTAQVIGSGTGNAALDRLNEYMKTHPTYDPNAAGNAPKKASGDQNWRGGLVEVGDAGMELIRLANNRLMLATRPMLLNLERGSQIYNNQQTNAMFKSLPAGPQQIHNMYQNSSNNYGNSYSNSTQNFNLNANLPVDLTNALQRYYRQQQFLYGR
jgi:tape measure domain-containing protein